MSFLKNLRQEGYRLYYNFCFSGMKRTYETPRQVFYGVWYSNYLKKITHILFLPKQEKQENLFILFHFISMYLNMQTHLKLVLFKRIIIMSLYDNLKKINKLNKADSS